MIAASWSETDLALIALALWLVVTPALTVAAFRARTEPARFLVYLLVALAVAFESTALHGDLAGTSPWLMAAFGWTIFAAGTVRCWNDPRRRLLADILDAAVLGGTLARLGWLWLATDFDPPLLAVYSTVALGPSVVLAVTSLSKTTPKLGRRRLSTGHMFAVFGLGGMLAGIVALRSFDEGPARTLDELRDPVVYVSAELDEPKSAATRVTVYWSTKDESTCRPLASEITVSLGDTSARRLDAGHSRWIPGRFGLPVRVCRARATFVVPAVPSPNLGRLEWSDTKHRWTMHVSEQPLPLSCTPASRRGLSDDGLVFDCSRRQ